MKSLACLLLLTTASLAPAEDWPQWLGPKRDSSTSEKVAAWTEAPKPLWKFAVGVGHSVPVIAEGRVFLHARVPNEEAEELIALEVKTGKQLWREKYERAPYASVLNTGPQSTPAVSDGKVYTFGITGLLSCFEAETGKRLWQNDVYKQFKIGLPRFGVCCSPVVIGNRVLVPVGGKGSGVVAFDTKKGEVEWQALDDLASTASPVLFNGAKGPDVVFMTSSRLVALSPLDGSVSWEYPLVFQPNGASPTPIVVGNQIVTSTMTNGTTAIRVDFRDEKPNSEQVWQEKELHGYFSSGTCANKERLYVISNTLKPIPAATLNCIDLKSGKELWVKKSIGYFHAGIIRTGDGKLLILDDAGTLRLAEENGKAYRELCKASVCGGTLTAPALADGKLFVRDGKEVVCYQLVGE